MMNIYVNGVETPIEFPDQAIPRVQMSGDKSSWTVDFGNRFKQVGGIIAVPFKNTTEAAVTISLPFTTLFDFQATPVDVQGPLGEAAYIEILANNKVRIYARTGRDYTGDFHIKWSASGVVA